eukprot:scaffold1991_cov218-Pinguiococcus_pyrenoidosus.AAC.1
MRRDTLVWQRLESVVENLTAGKGTGWRKPLLARAFVGEEGIRTCRLHGSREKGQLNPRFINFVSIRARPRSLRAADTKRLRISFGVKSESTCSPSEQPSHGPKKLLGASYALHLFTRKALQQLFCAVHRRSALSTAGLRCPPQHLASCRASIRARFEKLHVGHVGFNAITRIAACLAARAARGRGAEVHLLMIPVGRVAIFLVFGARLARGARASLLADTTFPGRLCREARPRS